MGRTYNPRARSKLYWIRRLWGAPGREGMGCRGVDQRIGTAYESHRHVLNGDAMIGAKLKWICYTYTVHDGI